jgi:hypothetical protein
MRRTGSPEADTGRVPAPLTGVPPRGRARLLGPVAAALVLAGCASAPAAESSGSASTTSSDDAAAAAQYTRNTPPAAARMVCSDEIRGEVADALNLESVPAPESTWADHVYGCSYAPPMGRLVLSVTVDRSSGAADRTLQTIRNGLAGAAAEPGLGERAYGSPAGVVVSKKDNLVLTVDATGLPDDLGDTHESRLDLARVITAGVFNCWTGSS